MGRYYSPLDRGDHGRKNQIHRAYEVQADDRGIPAGGNRGTEEGSEQRSHRDDARLIETKNASVDPEVLEVVLSELRATARATHEGSRKVQRCRKCPAAGTPDPIPVEFAVGWMARYNLA